LRAFTWSDGRSNLESFAAPRNNYISPISSYIRLSINL
jgi:hypothetical protein